MEKISWIDRVRNEVLHRVKQERNVLRTVKRRQTVWVLRKGLKILSGQRIVPHFLQRLITLLRLSTIKEFLVIQRNSFSWEIIRSIRRV